MHNEIIKAVADVLEIPEELILTKNRQSLYVMARTIIIVQLRKRGWAWQGIARLFGFHHASVMHCYMKYYDYYDVSLLFRFVVGQVQNHLANKEYLKLSDLTAIIYETINFNKYYKRESRTIQSIIAYNVFNRCGYSHRIFPQNFTKINMLTMSDEDVINQIYHQIKEYIDAKELSNRVSCEGG